MLPAVVQELIARQPKGEPNDRVFRPTKGSGGIALTKPWRQVRVEAGLADDIGLHNLRHSVGSHLAMNQATLAEIMTQLGHTDPKSSLRYIHFAERARSTLGQNAQPPLPWPG